MKKLIGLLAAIIALSSVTDLDANRRRQAEKNAKKILKMLVGTADKLVGWALFIIAVSPVIMTLAALATNSVGFKAFVALLPVIGLFLYVFGGMRHPSVIAAIKLLPDGKKVLRSILIIGGIEFAHGFALSAIPFANDPALLLLATVGIIAIGFLAGTGSKEAKPFIRWIGFGVVIAVIFVFLGGRDYLNSLSSPQDTTIPSRPTIDVTCAKSADERERRLLDGGRAIVTVDDGCHTPWITVQGNRFRVNGCLLGEYVYSDGTRSGTIDLCSGGKLGTSKVIREARFKSGNDSGSASATVTFNRHF